MIAYLRGTVAAVTQTRIVIEVNGVGFQAFINSRDASCMPGRGEEIILYTYLSVREDAMQLFGFLDEDDLEMFRLLLTVSGVGPKAGLGILSVLDADDIRFAVLSDDVKTISRAPGIGGKTAKKLILELKDKLSLEDAFEKKLAHSEEAAGTPLDDAKSEAVQALTALGYSGSDALRAVRGVETTEDMDTEAILKQALRVITSM